MILPRLIPILLLDGPGLVKTVRFDEKIYIGDPCNTVRIFNEKQVDELVLLDISCRKAGIQFDRIQDIVSEAFMPVAYGGGVDNITQAERLLQIGIEKLVLRTAAISNPDFVSEVSKKFGASTTVICMDVIKTDKGWRLLGHPNHHLHEEEPLHFAHRMEDLGAGEVILQSVDRDGTMVGYDLDLVQTVTQELSIPVVAAGGAGTLDHLRQVVHVAGASAAAAGAFFVFQGKHRAVLITYPEPAVVDALFGGQA